MTIGRHVVTRLPRLDLDADISVGGGAVIGAGMSSVLDTQVGGDLEIVGGGKIKGAGTIQILPTGAYYTQIGDAGAPGHLGTPTNDDCFISGRLEVDGMTFFDYGITMPVGANLYLAAGAAGLFDSPYWSLTFGARGRIDFENGAPSLSAPVAAADPAQNGRVMIWINEATHTLNIRAKYSNGTVKNLTTPLALS
jgi:hypothetical protein